MKCGYCNSLIVMGGVRQGAQRYCNNKCAQSAQVLRVAQHVPEDVLDRQVEEIFHGNCPKCRGLGPVDLHKVHRVWSALLLTSWSSSGQVCCRSCARRSQLGGILFSLVFGWWGFPWGLALTPIQIIRNLAAIGSGLDSSRPSEGLRKLVRVNLGLRLLQARQQQAAKGSAVVQV